MMLGLRKNILLFVVFITGACILIIELTALRVLTPYFGNTIFSATSVITTILLSLSIGYAVGGRLSDKRPDESLFYKIILIGGLLVLVMHMLINILVPRIAYSLPITTGPLIISLILFLVPSLLLGMLSPFVITLQKKKFPKEGIGKVSGNVFFVSTLGSICGSLLTGFYLIPHFGAKQIILITGFVLVSIGAVGYLNKKTGNATLMMIIFVVTATLVVKNSSPQINLVYARDGVYTHIGVLDTLIDDRPARVFMQDSSSASAIYLDGDDLAFDYSKYFEIYKLTMDAPSNVYIIGAGTYSLPKAYSHISPDVEVDVVDIEPELEQLALDYFKLQKTDQIVSHTTDGRRFLHDSDKLYDVIFGDVYFSLYSIPSQFTTVEFFELVRDKLRDNGVFVMNIIGSTNENRHDFLVSELATFRKVFPNYLLFVADGEDNSEVQNFILVGTISDANLVEKLEANQLGHLRDSIVQIDDELLNKAHILTDDFAPVDFMNAKILLE